MRSLCNALASGIKATSLEDLVDQSNKDAIKQENIAKGSETQLKSDFEELVASYEPGNALYSRLLLIFSLRLGTYSV
jgi:hypothetical protein